MVFFESLEKAEDLENSGLTNLQNKDYIKSMGLELAKKEGFTGVASKGTNYAAVAKQAGDMAGVKDDSVAGGALSGAVTGSQFGPQGAIIGAVLSGIVGGLKGRQQQRDLNAQADAAHNVRSADIEATRSAMRQSIINNLGANLAQVLNRR